MNNSTRQPDSREIETIDRNGITNLDNNSIKDGKAPIGINKLDLNLGGFPKGSVIALQIDPRSIGEYIAYHLSAVQQTNYITTARTKKDIEDGFNGMKGIGRVPGHVRIKDLTRENNEYQSFKAMISDETAENIIIDTFEMLIQKLDKNPISIYRSIKNQVRNNQGVALLVMTKNGNGRNMQNVLHACDSVLTVELEDRGRTSVSQTLKITKIRGNDEITDEKMEIILQEILTIDETNIS